MALESNDILCHSRVIDSHRGDIDEDHWQFWKPIVADFSSMDGVGGDCQQPADEAVVSMAMAKVEERYHAA
jgi:hypothetical protein